MPITGKVSGGGVERPPLAAGTHVAVCDIVAALGVQPGTGLYPQPKLQVFLRFQIPEERIEFERDGKKLSGPAVIGKTYTLSMHEKANLRHDLDGWRGRTFTDDEAAVFDIGSVLGVACMLNVIHKTKDGKTYANIASIGGLPKVIPKGSIKAEGTPIYYAPDDTSKYEQLPEWIRKKIDGQILPEKKEEPEAQDEKWSDGGGPLEDGSYVDDDDIPF